jgi:membrane protease YdiL (CAAX protease family)
VTHEPHTHGQFIESGDPPPREKPAGPPGTPAESETAANASLVQLSLLFYGVLLGLAAAWSFVSGDALMYAQSPAGELGGIGDIAVDVAIGAGAAMGVIRLSRELTLRTRWGEALADALAGAIGRLSVGECIVLALASGVAEEAFFRGALQPLVGLLAASAIFGLAHIAPRRELWPWTLFAAVTGLLMGGLFEWTGNLIAPTVAHVVINAVNLRLLAQRSS